jgi:hypothetical protein
MPSHAQEVQTQNPQYSIVERFSSVPHDQVVGAVKEALLSGMQSAVRELGHDGGFLTNLNVRIPIPKQLQPIERTLRLLKEDQLADELVVTMNHAAERAVPEAASVFGDAISRMSIADAEAVVTGPPDAATEYFRRATETNLFQRFLPVVKRATDETGVTSTYKRIEQSASRNRFLSPLLGGISGSQSLDLDSYITQKALDGLFKEIAAEEQRIRQNPVARTSELLRRVFGAVTGR